jgi:hypothetical protein
MAFLREHGGRDMLMDSLHRVVESGESEANPDERDLCLIGQFCSLVVIGARFRVLTPDPDHLRELQAAFAQSNALRGHLYTRNFALLDNLSSASLEGEYRTLEDPEALGRFWEAVAAFMSARASEPLFRFYSRCLRPGGLDEILAQLRSSEFSPWRQSRDDPSRDAEGYGVTQRRLDRLLEALGEDDAIELAAFFEVCSDFQEAVALPRIEATGWSILQGHLLDLFKPWLAPAMDEKSCVELQDGLRSLVRNEILTESDANSITAALTAIRSIYKDQFVHA